MYKKLSPKILGVLKKINVPIRLRKKLLNRFFKIKKKKKELNKKIIKLKKCLIAYIFFNSFILKTISPRATGRSKITPYLLYFFTDERV